VSDSSFVEVDFEEVLKRLTRYAQGLLGAARLLTDRRVDVALPGGDGPGDLAIALLVKFLDPADSTVAWKSADKPTTKRVFALLKKALFNDLLDLKKSARYTTTVYADTVEADPEAPPSLDSYPAKAASQLDSAMQSELIEKILKDFSDDPKAAEMLRLQLDPDGYKAFTNVELSVLLDVSVDEIENRKKRARNRLLMILQRQDKEGGANAKAQG
jgi:DNA-directed RNA polymerase specialized sigma24 family protein